MCLGNWKYVKGYWNFSNENKLQITEDLTLVYGNDNKSYWYTGITSVGKDESAVGFVLVVSIFIFFEPFGRVVFLLIHQ